MTDHIARLNHLSLSEIRLSFSTLPPPEISMLYGLFRGIFVGPAWLLPLWPPTLAITGLGGWWGKDFDDNGEAINIVFRRGAYQRIFPMFPIAQDSYLDRQPGLALRYRPESPFPWPKIVDELRCIDDDHILGMTLVDIGPLRRLGFPFVLQRREALNAR